jgi:hypothetical protein
MNEDDIKSYNYDVLIPVDYKGFYFYYDVLCPVDYKGFYFLPKIHIAKPGGCHEENF